MEQPSVTRRSTGLPVQRTARRSNSGTTCRNVAPGAGRDMPGAATVAGSVRICVFCIGRTLCGSANSLGTWECDLMQFRKKFGEANVTSLVERVSRFTVFLRNNDRQSRPIMERLIRTLQALPHLPAAPSPSTAAPNSPTGRISRPDLARRPGFAIRSRPGRKARSRTPTAGPEDGCRGRLTRSPSAIPNCVASAIISMPHRANVWASGHPRRSSAKSSWQESDEPVSLSKLQSRAWPRTHIL